MVQPQTRSSDLSSYLDILEDPGGQLTLHDIAEGGSHAHRFRPWGGSPSSFNVGYTESAYWVRFSLSRAPQAPGQWLLQVAYAYNKHLDFYAPQEPAVITGSGRPLATRPLFDKFFLFPVTLETEPKTFYFRVASNYALSLPLTLWNPSAYSKEALNANLAQALYYGGLLTIALYNLFLFFSLRDQRFLFYALFALSLNLGMLSGNGLGLLLLWPDWLIFNEIASQLFFCISGAMGLHFCRLFLQTAAHSSRIDRLMMANEAGFLLLAGLLLLTTTGGSSPQPLFLGMLSVSVVAITLIVAASVQAIRHAVPAIRFFLLAWGIFVVGMIVAVMRQLNWLPTNTLTSYAMQISSGIEMLLLAFALAEIVQAERRERLKAQAKELSATEKMLETVRNTEQRLENAVKERTQELEQAMQRERHLLNQFIRFGALISHEFRNPLGIIDSQALMIRKSKGLSPESEHRIDTIRKTVRRLVELFNKWLQGDRIRLAMENIHIQAIELQAWFEKVIAKIPHCTEQHHITLKIDPPTFKIWADKDLLEIAVVNLIENACKYSPPGSVIVVESLHANGQSGIAVCDSGTGIARQHLQQLGTDYYRIHEHRDLPGLGLGLSFVKEIAEVHGGELRIESEMNVGSRFAILLPDKP